MTEQKSNIPHQRAVLEWAVSSFGDIAKNRDERAARLVEEAMEVAQAENVPLEVVQRIADRIYSRPVGELGQEIGGLGITLMALAENCGIDYAAEVDREWRRVLSKPRDWWQKKHAEKVAAGTANLTPIAPKHGVTPPGMVRSLHIHLDVLGALTHFQRSEWLDADAAAAHRGRHGARR